MRRAALLLFGLFALSVLGKAVADDAGIWQFLLNDGRRDFPQASAPAPAAIPALAPSHAPKLTVRHAPKLTMRLTSRPRIVEKLRLLRPKALARTDLPQKLAISIYDDRTLRRGDSVMSTHGLRVFRGSSTFPYRPTDFVDLEQASRFVVGDRKQLRAIQLAFEQIDVPVTQIATLTTGRSASSAYSSGYRIDPAGKTIRYVGP
jgi:hypothetical protein